MGCPGMPPYIIGCPGIYYIDCPGICCMPPYIMGYPGIYCCIPGCIYIPGYIYIGCPIICYYCIIYCYC